jgi:hypothetical protein
MEMKEDEKEGAKMEKKEKRKKKEDPSSSGQEPDSGTTVDAKITAIIQPPVAATEIPPAIDAGEVNFLHSSQSNPIAQKPGSLLCRHARQRRSPSRRSQSLSRK